MLILGPGIYVLWSWGMPCGIVNWYLISLFKKFQIL